MKKIEFFFLGLILLGACVTRLYRFNGPIADWHSWRQADTSAVSRNFIKYGFDIFHPKFDDLSNVPSGKDNPMGYRFVEFPIYNIFQAGFYKFIGIFTLEEWGRMVTIFSSLFSILFLFLLTKKHLNSYVAFAAAFFYAFIPYNIYYGRSILPDTSMVAAILAGTYFFDRWMSRNFQSASWRTIFNFQFFLALLFTAASFLLKPYALFFTLPMIILTYKKFGISFFKKWQLWIFLILSVAPLVFWRKWMMQFPEGIPVSDWLYNGNGIRFRPSFFRWIGYERIIKLISGYSGVFLLIFGIFKSYRLKEKLFFYSFLVSSIVYVCVFATGNVQHDYYQILVMPSVAIFMGIGTVQLFSYLKRFSNTIIASLVVLFLISSMFYFGWQQVKDFFNINNHSMIIAGREIDKLIPKDAKIIAPYNGDTSFLYQTNRQGWASFEKPLPEMIKMGAHYLVFLNPTIKDEEPGKLYKIVSKTKDYILFDLHKKP